MNADVDQETALDLWRRWFEWSGDPLFHNGDRREVECFFCAKEDGEHEADCVFILAKRLVEAQA